MISIPADRGIFCPESQFMGKEQLSIQNRTHIQQRRLRLLYPCWQEHRLASLLGFPAIRLTQLKQSYKLIWVRVDHSGGPSAALFELRECLVYTAASVRLCAGKPLNSSREISFESGTPIPSQWFTMMKAVGTALAINSRK